MSGHEVIRNYIMGINSSYHSRKRSNSSTQKLLRLPKSLIEVRSVVPLVIFLKVPIEIYHSVSLVRFIQGRTSRISGVHFSNDRDTTSTGKPASNGEHVCPAPICEPVRHLITFSPTSLLTAAAAPIISSYFASL